MFELICYISDTVKEVVKSNNQRDFDISHDNNQTKIELSKVVLGGMTLLGTLALQFYCSSQDNSENKFEEN